MQKWKLAGMMICLVLFLVPLIATPIVQGWLTNIWGPSEGTVKMYSYQNTYTGTIEQTVDYGDHIFRVVSIWDNDGNNYTELLYSRQKTAGQLPDVDLFTLNDNAANWNYNDLITVISGGELYPLVPIGYNQTNSVGMNWTAQINTIKTLTNYTVTFETDAVFIYHWTTGTDILTGAPILGYEYIRWNNLTGWLTSYKLIMDYGDPMNYTSTLLIQVKSITGGGLVLDLTLIIGIIGAVTGAIAIAFAFIALKKAKK